MSVPCMICKERESTGIIFQMCDECFAEFEKKLPAEGGYEPTEEELESINEPFIDRSGN